MGVSKIVSEFPGLFAKKLGLYTKGKFKLHLKENVRPVFCKPRPVPYVMRERLESEITSLECDKIITAVESSE